MISKTKQEFIEEWDWLTGKPLGIPVDRSVAHKEGIPHEGVHLWIYKIIAGQIWILLQKRSSRKDLYPSVLDISVGGHVPFGLNEGKIQKEASEELGIDVSDEELTDLGYFRYEEKIPQMDLFHREFQHIWIMNSNIEIDDYSFSDGEVEAVCFIRLDDFISVLSGEISFAESLYYDGKDVYKKKIELEEFHPLFFSPGMKEYLTIIIEAIRQNS